MNWSKTDKVMAKSVENHMYIFFNSTNLLKLVMKGNNSEVTEVPELGSGLRTWLQRICCTLARRTECMEFRSIGVFGANTERDRDRDRDKDRSDDSEQGCLF